jgi:hypothetical protein
MNTLLRRVSAVAVVSVVACGQSNGSASADTVRFDSARVAGSAGTPTDTVAPVAAPVVHTAPTAGTLAITQRTSRRVVGCRGQFVNVTIKASALGDGSDAAATTRALRAASSDLLAPVRNETGSISLSPAIRAFRVAAKDSAAAQRVVARLRGSPIVESVEVDRCDATIQR